ncbi:hypothetical protein NQZ68_001780 [Dissostichus eleginoides]|nr:hypothetical protein NQZ68_001780 [Dissostichus eleginoides]
MPRSTNNNTASRNKLEPVTKHGLYTMFSTHPGMSTCLPSLQPHRSPVTRMLTKARELLSGAEDRHNGRKEAGSRKRGSRYSPTKYYFLPPP